MRVQAAEFGLRFGLWGLGFEGEVVDFRKALLELLLIATRATIATCFLKGACKVVLPRNGM